VAGMVGDGGYIPTGINLEVIRRYASDVKDI
jgi:hypothetical protein